jgi:hypothetical protein
MKPLYYSSLLFSSLALSLPPSLPLVAGRARARAITRSLGNRRTSEESQTLGSSRAVILFLANFRILKTKKMATTLGHLFSSLESDPVGQFWLNPLVAIANPPTSQISKNRKKRKQAQAATD